MAGSNTHAHNPDHAALALPFVRWPTDKERRAGRRGLIFWSVTPSGDMLADNSAGALMAAQALRFMVENNSPHIAHWAVQEMIAQGPHRSAIETGFLSFLSRMAMGGFTVFAVSGKTDLLLPIPNKEVE